MAGPPDKLKCNGCSMELHPLTQCVATMCSHLFCTDCAQTIIERDEPCPLCQGVMSKGSVKLVTVLQPANRLKLLLCGQTPEAIAESALTGINCYVEQQRLSCMHVSHQLKHKMARVKTQYQQKMAEMQEHYAQARQKYAQAVQQRNALEQDNQELQQKYAQKASQARKLQEMFKALQAENEELKRVLGVRSGAGGASGAGRSAGQGLALSGRGMGGSGTAARQVSPFGAGPTQMVTTVQHTKAMFDLSPASATGLHLLTGHGSAVAGSGHAMFGGPQRSMGGGGGQRPSTAGGMFGAAALGNNGRGGGAGGGNGLRLQGGFSSPAGGGFSNLTG